MPKSYREIRKLVEERKAFTGNSMTAKYIHVGDSIGGGKLPDHDMEWIRHDFDTANKNGQPFYVVYSYATPIAWAYGTTVRIPDVRYSVTTSKQQSLVRGAWK